MSTFEPGIRIYRKMRRKLAIDPLEEEWNEWRNLRRSTAPASPESSTAREQEDLDLIKNTRGLTPYDKMRS